MNSLPDLDFVNVHIKDRQIYCSRLNREIFKKLFLQPFHGFCFQIRGYSHVIPCVTAPNLTPNGNRVKSCEIATSVGLQCRDSQSVSIPEVIFWRFFHVIWIVRV